MTFSNFVLIFSVFLLFTVCQALPERGHFDLHFNQETSKSSNVKVKSIFKGTFIDLKVSCENGEKLLNGTITIETRILRCFSRNVNSEVDDGKSTETYQSFVMLPCLQDNVAESIVYPNRFKIDNNNLEMFTNDSKKHFLTTSKDGIYRFKFSFTSKQQYSNVSLQVDIRSSYGFLSAAQWPLLVFYSVMCGLYSFLALVWLVLSCRNWRDLLRIQFWIGAVIFLGMLEKALLVSEYESINKTGVPLNYPVLIAEVVSCIKRMLARVLIMIVCIGYGIVKPRLGPAMKKIIGVGLVFLISALIEAFIRVLYPDLTYVFIPNLVLVVTDSIIMWWSFSYLIQTIKEMRMRHNVVKFNLYRHFSNILIIVIVVSVLFMAWSLYTFNSSKCVLSWKEIWINEAFWHVLFSVVLMTIMFLWRPSKNSQRYAYSPLLDEENIDLLDEEEENVTMDNLTSGELRKPNKDGSKEKKVVEKKTAEDDLRWIEENIPASAAEKIYPIVDSEEELTTTKITSGKMD